MLSTVAHALLAAILASSMLLSTIKAAPAPALLATDFTVDVPIDHPWLRSFMSSPPSSKAALTKRYTPPAPAGCRNLVDADLLSVPADVIRALLTAVNGFLAEQGGSSACMTPGADNDCADVDYFISQGGIGTGKQTPDTSKVLGSLFIGDAAAYSGKQADDWPVVCMGTANVAPTSFYPDSCSTQSSTIVGGVHGTSASITAAIKQDTNLAIQVTTTTEQSITAGLSVTVSEEVGVEGVAEESASATVSFSYTYDTTDGTSKTETTDNTNTLSVTVNPADGQACSLITYETTCQGSAPVTIPVTFRGQIQAYITNGYGGSHHYIFIPLQDTIAGAGVDGSMDIKQTVGLSLEATGGYNISCVSDGSTIDNSGYIPTLECPATLGTFAGVCSATLNDYIGQHAVKTDSSNWQARGLYQSQMPGAGATVSYGQTQVSFEVQGPGIPSTTCSSTVQVTPPWEADFQPQLEVLQYPSDGSSVSAYYTVDYIGGCDALQGGSCHVSSITSDNADSLSWVSTTAGNNPQQSFKLSNDGQPWPQSDTLTFVVKCSDSYGNQGSALFYQKAIAIPQATSTVPGATSTLTLHTLTDDLETTTLTLSTSVSTPLATKELLETVDYYTTIYTRTTSKKAQKTVVTTKTQRVTTTDVHRTTVTAPQSTTTMQLSVAKPTTYTVFATSTPTTTVTKAAKSTTTSTASTCTKGHSSSTTTSKHGSHPQKRAKTYLPATGTTTFSNPSITSTVIDSIDTYTLYTSAYTTATDKIGVVYKTAPTSTITDFFTAESKLYAVLTKYPATTTITSTVTSVVSQDTTTTIVSQPPVKTITLSPTADQSTVLKTVTRTASTVTSYVTPSLTTTTVTPKCSATSS